jgi:hypothetical protein
MGDGNSSGVPKAEPPTLDRGCELNADELKAILVLASNLQYIGWGWVVAAVSAAPVARLAWGVQSFIPVVLVLAVVVWCGCQLAWAGRALRRFVSTKPASLDGLLTGLGWLSSASGTGLLLVPAAVASVVFGALALWSLIEGG